MERDVRDLDWRDLATSIPLELSDVPLDGLEYLGLVVDDLHEGRRLGKVGRLGREHRLEMVGEVLEQVVVTIKVDADLARHVTDEHAGELLDLHVIDAELGASLKAKGLPQRRKEQRLVRTHVDQAVLAYKPHDLTLETTDVLLGAIMVTAPSSSRRAPLRLRMTQMHR